MNQPLTCKELVEVVTDYLEGAFSKQEEQRFDQHLTRCEGCCIYLEHMRQTINMVGTLCEDTTVPQVHVEMLEA